MLGGRVSPDVLRTDCRLHEGMNKEPMKLTEGDKELVGLVAVGLTDDEIAMQLQIPKHNVLKQIERLLAKLGIRDRVEIVLYAYSDPATYQRINTEVLNRTTKNPQAKTPQVKQKAS
jgi:DNA-binding NarL/FixJ family response regulator